MRIVNFEQEHCADGFLESRRYEHEVLVLITRTRTLPSGKQITLTLGAQGNLVSESHGYGILQFSLQREFSGGHAESETYYRNRRLIARAAYEKARVAYPDMPAADPALPDHAADTLRWLRSESRRKKPAREPDPVAASKLDAFCEELLQGRDLEDAFAWLDRGKPRLGEMSAQTSRRFLLALREWGCPAVHACKMERDHELPMNSSDLVIELPPEPAARAKVLQRVGKIAKEQGYDPYPDDGQKFLYAKMS